MLDGIFKKQKKPVELDYALAKFVLKHKNSSVLLSEKFGKVRDFTTRDSKLYFTQNELLKMRRGEKVGFVSGRIDSIALRREKNAPYTFAKKKEDWMYEGIKERYSSLRAYLGDALHGYTHGVSMTRMWNMSLIGSLIFGMFLMTMIYRYLGPGAQAKMQEVKDRAETEQIVKKQEEQKVLGESIAKAEADKKALVDAEKKTAQDAILKKQKEFGDKILDLVGNHPIKKMVPYMTKEDPLVVAFFIAIARQESSWGEHVPLNDSGDDCYNYVGFRLKTPKMGTNGHSCFSSPQEGFERTVKRIKDLIYNENMTTAQKMVSPWKCGYRPDLDNKEAVQRWVNNVDDILTQVRSWKIEGNR